MNTDFHEGTLILARYAVDYLLRQASIHCIGDPKWREMLVLAKNDLDLVITRRDAWVAAESERVTSELDQEFPK